MKTAGIVLIIVALLVIGGIAFTINSSDEESDKSASGPPVPPAPEGEDSLQGLPSLTAQEHSILITEEGFSPKILTIQQGDTVTWENQMSKDSWPASAVHPTHTVYPGSNIDKCGTAEEAETFDACKSISPGETYSFTFNERGDWNYHDHLSSSSTGTIVVQ